MNMDYRYEFEIKEGDPMAPQPENIILPLKPHQLASLHKAMIAEQTGKINYYIENPEEFLNAGLEVRSAFARRRSTYRNNYQVYTNIGILGDMVGYGKTMVALGMIASTPTRDLYTTRDITYSYTGHGSKANIRVDCERSEPVDLRTIFETTLVIAPRGPVYVQWKNALDNHTNLKHVAINDLGYIKRHCPPQGSTHEQLKDFFEKYDVVLIKNTTLQTLLSHYDNNPYQTSPIRGFARIMIDEAPDYLSKLPTLQYKFIWFISATYLQLLNQSYRGNGLGLIVRELLITTELIYTILVKCQQDFTIKSFSVPPYQEVVYTCVAPRYMSIVQPFLTDNIIQLVNANDIAGAIRELGGTTETEDNIVKLVSKNLQRELFNKEREKEYIEGLDMETEAKANKLRYIDEDLQKLLTKQKDLEERISTITKDVCSICYDTLSSPILLSCTHIFCGQCIMKWIETNQSNHTINQKVCPTCRCVISKDNLVAIVKDNNDVASSSNNTKLTNKKKQLTKLETVIDIITNKANGRFLVFSQYDHTFRELRDELTRRGISSCELKGTTGTMVNHLENFKSGTTRVILLNTYYAGSGIDISSATDVILFHHMGEVSKQAIGRAQRVGRTEALTVHKLYHPNELHEAR